MYWIGVFIVIGMYLFLYVRDNSKKLIPSRGEVIFSIIIAACSWAGILFGLFCYLSTVKQIEDWMDEPLYKKKHKGVLPAIIVAIMLLVCFAG